MFESISQNKREREKKKTIASFKMTGVDWKDESVFNSTCFSSQGPEFNS